MTKKICVVLFFFVLSAVSGVSQEPNKAAAQLTSSTTDTPHFHGGDEVSFTFKLNEPLPQDAHFDIRLSPTVIGQEFPVSSVEPVDPKNRKDFLVKYKISDHPFPGEWHISVTYLFLGGVSWTHSTISTNDMKFIVDGPKEELPTSATAAIVKK